MKVNLAHGSGGNATRELISNLFKKYFSNEFLDRLEDSACLPPTAYPLAMTTDSYVITPIVFPGGNIGKLAVCGTANDLWMVGAEPQYITAGFILEEGLELEVLEAAVKTMAQTAKEINVKIVTGDTKVIEGSGGLYINTAGLGFIKHRHQLGAERIKAGDSIIVSGTLGNHQSCIFAQRMKIENKITSDCACLGSMVEALLNSGLGLRIMRDITRGGLGTVLNEVAEAGKISIQIEEKLIPIDPEVKGFCDILGLDPIYMANEGKFMVIVDSRDEEKALEILRKNSLGKMAGVIGKVTETGNQLVTVKTKLGGSRIIDVLQGEGLPRIC
ncbi:hydrogenase expression/formation protein HypE [Syntrophobotulus glycolicus DSM 8271]|uniref:Hydrogenase expression/formation protein HypE n=1 Tax=Syntrophobotulus glycolicus (strain DSM 8271 / FlGlyR) TaxID=645991 RepID=F0T1Z9_SYNGF|nr:hydrogenase expression/formation protein HypE [Syntrophobotulus glycolicus]ADY56343.1 hydrogenase expression/formation protein HypE [Syntrophobotulus glycolicus DSM 8271]